MKFPSQFDEYLTTIGLPPPVVGRVVEAHELASANVPEELTGVLVADFLSGEQRQVEELWFFSEQLAVLFPNFLRQPSVAAEMAVIRLAGRLESATLTTGEEDVRLATWKSNSWMQVRFSHGIAEGTIQTVGQNCAFLHAVFRDYLVRWLTSAASTDGAS